MRRKKVQLVNVPIGTHFWCPWDGREGILLSCDTESHTSASIQLLPVRNEGGTIEQKGEKSEWSVGTTVEVKKERRFSLNDRQA